MRTITLKTQFIYWWHGYEPRGYGPGTVEVDEEVAVSAEQAGFVEKEKPKPTASATPITKEEAK